MKYYKIYRASGTSIIIQANRKPTEREAREHLHTAPVEIVEYDPPVPWDLPTSLKYYRVVISNGTITSVTIIQAERLPTPEEIRSSWMKFPPGSIYVEECEGTQVLSL